jgi:hypothetical protein
MSDEPALNELLKLRWRLRLEATQLQIQTVQAIAKSLCRNLELILSIARKRLWRRSR